MKTFSPLRSLLLASVIFISMSAQGREMNILFIVVDDLNDFVEPLAVLNPDGSVNQSANVVAKTPNLTRLANKGVLFTNAHSNSPVCNPSRSSMMTGLLPSTSRFYGFRPERWQSPVFNAVKSLPVFASDNGYRTFFTGKTFHVNEPGQWDRTNGIKPWHSPEFFNTAINGAAVRPDYPNAPLGNIVPDLSTTATFSTYGIDAMCGSLNIFNENPALSANYRFSNGNRELINRHALDVPTLAADHRFFTYYPRDPATGLGTNPFTGTVLPNVYNPSLSNYVYYANDDDRDLMVDELSLLYLKNEIVKFHWGNNTYKNIPFFAQVGFMKPHTPMIAPKKYFDLYSAADIDNLMARLNLSQNNAAQAINPSFLGNRGNSIYRYLKEGYDGQPDPQRGIKDYLHAYLACTSFIDDCSGKLIDSLDTMTDPVTGRPASESTIIVLTSDHGYHLGQKEYAWKYSMWDDSIRVPLIIKHPGSSYNATRGGKVNVPVSLVDIFPTIRDLGNMTAAPDNVIDHRYGKPLDGTSLVPFLTNTALTAEEWGGFPMALSMTTLSESDNTPRNQNASVRSARYRYTRYGSAKDSSGKYLYEEFYDYRNDPLEVNNIIKNAALYPAYETIIHEHRLEMNRMLSDDPKSSWEIDLSSETLLSAWHSFIPGSAATQLNDQPANEVISGVTAQLDPGPAASMTLATTSFGSGDATYGDFQSVNGSLPATNSALHLNGLVENHVIINIKNNTGKDYRLTNFHMDVRIPVSNGARTMSLEHIPDLNAGLLPNGKEYKNTIEYVLNYPPTGIGLTNFAPYVFNLAALAKDVAIIRDGEERNFALKIVAGGTIGNSNAYIDNLAIVGQEVGLPLAITRQPTATAAVFDQQARMDVDFVGDDVDFQWYRGVAGDIPGSVALEGQTNLALELENVTELDEGYYWVRLSNASESVNSDAALLTVNHPLFSSEVVLAGWCSPTQDENKQIGKGILGREFSDINISDVAAEAVWGRRVFSGATRNSADGSFGSFASPAAVSASTTFFEMDQGNTSNRFYMDLILRNNSAGLISVNQLRFDYRRDVDSSTKLDVLYVSGDLGIPANTKVAELSGYTANTYNNIDIALANFGNVSLPPGKVANFRLHIGAVTTPITVVNTVVAIDNLAFTGTYVTSFDAAPAIGFNTFPSDVAAYTGQTATFSVSAFGANLGYQWYEGDRGNTNDPIPGATGASYTKPALTGLDNGTTYWVRIQSGPYRADSQAATLWVSSGAPSENYATWISGYNTNGQSGEMDDPDGDGVNNFLEYALNGNPTRPDNSTVLPEIMKVGASIKVEFYVKDTNLNYSIEYSQDLLTWETLSLTGTLVKGNYYGQWVPMLTENAFFRIRVAK